MEFGIHTYIQTDRQRRTAWQGLLLLIPFTRQLELGKHPWLPADCCPDDNVKHQTKHTAKHLGIKKNHRGRILRESCVTEIWRDVCGQTIGI